MIRLCFFLNGPYQSSDITIELESVKIVPLHLLNNSPSHIKMKKTIQTFVADGGIRHLAQKKISYFYANKKIIWFGDEDSLTQSSHRYLKKNTFIEKQTLSREKDVSDLGAILDFIGTLQWSEPVFIEIYGGLGGRRDHEIANIEEIRNFLFSLPQGGTALFHGGILLSGVPLKILRTGYSYFSIFANTGSVEVSGAKYSGHFHLKRASHGLSNESLGKPIGFVPHNGIMTICFEDSFG